MPQLVEDNVDLKPTDCLIFLQQTGFIWEQQEIAIQDMWSTGEPWQSQRIKGRNFFFFFTEKKRSLERPLQTKSPMRGTGSSKCSDFSWAESFIG